MRDSIAVRKWLDVAASGIRFAPDQAEVKAELLEHIEDKTADLMRIFPGMEEKEAQERALESMGDAWELKSELARVHTPWLGWLWTASRLVVWGFLAAGLLLCLVFGISWAARGGFPDLGFQWRESRELQAVNRALYEDGVPNWEGERLAVFVPDARLRLDRATVSVPRAAWWREDGEDQLYLQTKITWDRPWERDHRIFFYLWLEDDLGNHYLDEGTNSIPCRLGGGQGLRTEWINLRLEHVPPEAEHLHLHSMLRDDLDLVIDLDREVKS